MTPLHRKNSLERKRTEAGKKYKLRIFFLQEGMCCLCDSENELAERKSCGVGVGLAEEKRGNAGGKFLRRCERDWDPEQDGRRPLE